MSTIATILKDAVERWAYRLAETNELMPLARANRMTVRALAVYLESLRHLFAQAEPNLSYAVQRCRALEDCELEEYFLRKLREEVGHDRWAEEDLQQLPAAARSQLRPAQSAVALANFQRLTVEQHPLCYVTYIVWTEYFSVLLGDAWLDDLSASGFQRAGVTSLDKHLVLDRDHAPFSFNELDRLWRGEPPVAELLAVVDRAGQLFEDMCGEICAVAREPDALGPAVQP